MINNGEKFELICFHRLGLDDDIPEWIELPCGFFATRKLPGEIDEHWRQWRGSIRIQQLERANLYLGCKKASRSPGILDDENLFLDRRLRCLYWSVFLTGYVRVFDSPIQISGAMEDVRFNIRQFKDLNQTYCVPGSPRTGCALNLNALMDAGGLAGSIDELFQDDTHRRFKRVMHAFFSALNSPLADVRLHQFVRCIEGFILPNIGDTTRQFKSRTQLFIGPSFHSLIEELYKLRSLAEHMHEVLDYFPVPDHRAKMALLFQRSYEAEAVARYCISRFLRTRDLWPYFHDDARTRAFWELDQQTRTQLWGPPLDLNALSSRFAPDTIQEIELVG